MGKNKKNNNPALNRIIHEPARLQIISYLAAGDKTVSFTELSEKLGFSSGNLSVQLKKLEEAGYVSIAKSFRNNRPLTSVSLTSRGMKALKLYLQDLEFIIDRVKDSVQTQENDQA